MHFEYVPKSPGYKFTLWWGLNDQLTFYIGTNCHRWGKFYFFRDAVIYSLQDYEYWGLR